MTAALLAIGILIGAVLGIAGMALYDAAVEANEDMARHVHRNYTVQKGVER